MAEFFKAIGIVFGIVGLLVFFFGLGFWVNGGPADWSTPLIGLLLFAISFVFSNISERF